MNIDELKGWIGRSETSNDAAVATSLNALAATLGVTQLFDLQRQAIPAARVTEFSFRAVRPVIDTSSFSVCEDRQDDGSICRWAQDAAGHLATTTTARAA